ASGRAAGGRLRRQDRDGGCGCDQSSFGRPHGAAPQPSRLRLPVPPPAAGLQRRGERDPSPARCRGAAFGGERARPPVARLARPRSPADPSAEPAFRRGAAAGRGRPGARQPSPARAGGRADGKPRRGYFGQGARAVPRAGPGSGQRRPRRHAQRTVGAADGPHRADPRGRRRVGRYSAAAIAARMAASSTGTSITWPSTVSVAVSPLISTLPSSPMSTTWFSPSTVMLPSSPRSTVVSAMSAPAMAPLAIVAVPVIAAVTIATTKYSTIAARIVTTV